MHIAGEVGERIVAPRNLMVSEFAFEENSCCPWTLEQPLFLWRGEALWIDQGDLVVERLDGTVVRPPLRGRRRGVAAQRPRR